MTRTTTSRPRMAATYAPGTVRARRWHGEGDVRGYRPPPRLDSLRRPDRLASHHRPRLAACRVVDHRNQGITSSTGPKPFRLGAGGRKSGRGGGRARFQRPKQNRHVAAFDQAATWRTCKCLARGTAIGARWRGQGFDGAPPQWAGLVGLRPGLLRQVVPKRVVLDAGGSRLYVTKDGSPTRHPASLWSIHATPQARRRNLRQGAFSLVVGVLALPASGRKPVKPSRGDAESATSPFGSGRPVRPWLVVNPGEGTAAPWASWPQPSSENNFPAAARLPRGTNSFRFQVLHGVATAARCGQPIPRRPDHNKDALARPCSTRKEKHHG